MGRAGFDILELIGRIHEGVADEGLWRGALGEVCDRLRVIHFLVGEMSRSGRAVHFEFGHNADPAAIALLEGPLADPDYNPWLSLASVHPLRRPATIADLGGQEVLEAARIWQEFYVPFQLGDTLGAALERQPEFAHFLVAGRMRHQPGFDSADLRLCRSLLPHIARAWRVRRTLTRWESLVGTLKFVLDRLDRAIIVTGPAGQVRFANRAAERLLSRGDGLDATRGRLRAATSRHSETLHALIDAASRTSFGSGAVAVDAVALPRAQEAAQPLAVVAEPLAPAHSDRLGHDDAPGAVLFIGESAVATRPSGNRLRTVYGLTAAEARIASLIVEGHDTQSAATESRLSPNTVKYHLKSIYGKVGVSRRTQFVRRVLADVGGLAEPDKLQP